MVASVGCFLVAACELGLVVMWYWFIVLVGFGLVIWGAQVCCFRIFYVQVVCLNCLCCA